MPSILSDDDKQTVKRAVPKPSNKIHAVAVAKLYVAYPNRSKWTDTGLQGAAVLANDLVGNTFWLKMVDISPASRGVIWDQELYDIFSYNQDRTFFHTFELEDCLAGLSFADDKEAKQFRKKMDEREKNAPKNTRGKPFAATVAAGGGGGATTVGGGEHEHHRFGLGRLLGGHRHSTASQAGPPQSIIPPKDVSINTAPAASSPARSTAPSEIDLNDPAVQAVLDDLLQMGITADQIHEHAGFIKTYLEQSKASVAHAEPQQRSSRAPPPPPPHPAAANLSPQNTGSSGKRGPPPAPPPSRRAGPGPGQQRPPSPSPSPPRAPSPTRARFRAPPPLADAGKFASSAAPSRARAESNPGPPPPPRPPKAPLLDDEAATPAKFGVPPPFDGKRIAPVPPPPPARSSVVPPPPPARDDVPMPPPPLLPTRDTPSSSHVPLPPPLPPVSARPAPIINNNPPAPPPLPPSAARPVPPAPAASGSLPPPPPPTPVSSGPPPPPPPMPLRASAPSSPSPALPAPAPSGLLADIHRGARLKKVTPGQQRDRSHALAETTLAAPPPAEAGGGGGLADALASALAARKSKVSHSDDEEGEDEW